MLSFSFKQHHVSGSQQRLAYQLSALLLSPFISALVLASETLTVTASVTDSGTGYQAQESATGSKISTAILEIPQSVSVVSRAQMDMLQPGSTSQALRYTAGASSERYGGNGDHLDMTRIRGAEADYYLDGLRVIGNIGTWSNQVDPYTLQRLDVLRGPSSFLYGQGSGGGIVNQISRKPQALAARQLQIQYGSFNDKRLNFDITGPLTSNHRVLWRLTLSARHAHGQIENTKRQQIYLAPSVTLHPSDRLSWTLLATWSQEPATPNYNSIPAIFYGLNHSPYPPIDRHKNYTDTQFAHSTRQQYSLTSLFNYGLHENWQFISNGRYMYLENGLKRGTVYGYTVTDHQPLFNGYYEIAPASSATFSMDNYLRGDMTTGNVLHTVLTGADFATGNIKNALYSDGGHYFSPYGDIYHPVITADFSSSFAAPWKDKQNFTRFGLYWQDQMALNRWRLTLSARYDWSKTDDYLNNYSSQLTLTHQNDTRLSGRAGLSYQFVTGIAPYISYATAFDPVFGSNYYGEVFKPLQTKQTEAGIKYQPDAANTLLSIAVFQLNQQNVKTTDPDPDHRGFNIQAGEIRTRGIDLQANAQLMPGLNLLSSYTWLDNSRVKDSDYQGKTLTQVPQHSAALWLDYQLPFIQGLTAGAGVRYQSATYGDPANSFTVPAVTVLDLAVNYDLQHIATALKGANLALNVSNLANRQYIASCTTGRYCFIGQDRTIIATASYHW